MARPLAAAWPPALLALKSDNGPMQGTVRALQVPPSVVVRCGRG